MPMPIIDTENQEIRLSGTRRQVIVGAVLGNADSPEQIRDKLETLTNNDRLDASAIKNLPQFQWNSTNW